MGRAPQKTLLEKKNSKYKEVGEVISDSYARAEITDSKLYMIDKVVRMRTQHGRFGIDHSELLNYELEQTNKPRDDHMNWLVYKTEGVSPMKAHLAQYDSDPKVSEILYERLKTKDEERYSDYSDRKRMGQFDE